MAEASSAPRAADSADIADLCMLAGDLAQVLAHTNAPPPAEFPAHQVTAIASALAELDTVHGEDGQRTLILARLRLREAGRSCAPMPGARTRPAISRFSGRTTPC